MRLQIIRRQTMSIYRALANRTPPDAQRRRVRPACQRRLFRRGGA